MEKRKHYLDNIRWITLCFVIIYHIFYIFNSSGVVSNIGVTGIKELDSICVFIYPWIMCLLFVVSGVSTNYSLKSKTNKEFIKDRAKRILVPSLIGIFVYGWISGWTTNYYGDIFAGNGSMIPVPIKYIIFSLIGIGPLWYAHVLFIASLLIVLVRKIDKNKKLDILFSKINLPLLFSLVLLVSCARRQALRCFPPLSLPRWWSIFSLSPKGRPRGRRSISSQRSFCRALSVCRSAELCFSAASVLRRAAQLSPLSAPLSPLPPRCLSCTSCSLSLSLPLPLCR